MSGFAYLIFVVGTLLAWALGAAGAYFYFRTRHREAIADLDALSRELDEREEELHRLQYQFTKTNPEGPSSAQLAELKKTQEELEQKRNDYNILKQDFDLEIGILKQELEQLKSGETDVEHTRRRIARKSSELKARESLLTEKEKDVNERAKRLDDDIAARKRHLEDQFSARLKRLEDGLRERDDELRARFDVLESEREALTRERTSLRKKQEQLDKELLDLPVHRFTSPQEALLIKRLRQQIKLQRDELEKLQRRVHRATTERVAGPTRAQRDTDDAGQDAAPQRSAGGDLAMVQSAGVRHGGGDDEDMQPAGMRDGGGDEAEVKPAGVIHGGDEADVKPARVGHGGNDDDAAVQSAGVQHGGNDGDAAASSRVVQRSEADAAGKAVADHDDSYPTYSTLSSYVQQDRSAVKEQAREEASPPGGSVGRTEPRDESSPKLDASNPHGRENDEAPGGLDMATEDARPSDVDLHRGPHEPTPDAALQEGTNPFRQDDLTSLPGINPQLQDRLYRLGITSFDQIARWSSSDVHRVSDKLEIDRKTIQDHWIIIAQSHLFSRKED